MKDLDILDKLRDRAALILTANGYHTNAGLNVFLGRVFDLEADPVPAIVITQPEDDADVVEDDETPTLPRMASLFVVEGYRAVDAADPLPDLMELRADLLHACYKPGADQPDTLDGIATASVLLGSTKLMPAPGGRVGMAQITLRVEYFEPFGD